MRQRDWRHEEKDHVSKDEARQRDPVEGDCDLCGEWAGRLVEGVCQPCRNQYHLDRPKRVW
jgi:hypothetical protein